MDTLWQSALLLAVLFGSLATGIWVGFALFIVGLVGMLLFTGVPVTYTVASSIWGAMASWALVPLPLFIWMGEILFRTRLSKDMFSAIAPWVQRIPGKLLHVNVLASGVFAAVSGSSAATVVTIGKMTIPELTARGYPRSLILGSLAGSGTLGLLIPPSITMIVYGVVSGTSIARLFIAGVIPGMLLIVFFVGYIAIWASLRKSRMPQTRTTYTLLEKLRQSLRILPIVGLIIAVIGSMYFGLATPTEASAFGVAGALLLAGFSGSLNRDTFMASISSAVKTTCMIGLLLAGASFLTTSMGFTGLPRELATWVNTMGLSPYKLLFVLTILFIILGCFLDGISIVVLTASIILPMVQAAGIDLIWFGIYMVIIVEMAQITPPVGFNLFVLQGMTQVDIFKLGIYAIPYFLLMALALVCIIVFPSIATWLPSTIF